jgi:hypothetical protein
MFTTLRKFTVIFLAILQLIAPLVHAHAGEKVSSLGLHVPGLERYDVEHEAAMSQTVTYDFSSADIGSRSIAALLTSTDGGNAVDCLEQARPPSQAVEGIIVGVDAGLKDAQTTTLVDLDNSHYLHQQAPAFNAAISPFDTNFSPQPAQFACRLFIPSLSPRAPPAQFSLFFVETSHCNVSIPLDCLKAL